MAVKRIAWEFDPRAEAPRHAPPDLRALTVHPFTAVERETLSDWLAETGWPRWRMDIATLEGYLVGLLIWPVDIAPGAWLPPIWGVAGWKVPAKINATEPYREFEDLIVAFLNDLDHRLSTPDPAFVPALSLGSTEWHPRRPPGVSWAQGCLRAVELGLQGMKGRSAAARAAAGRIAHYASASTIIPSSDGAIAAELAAAVSTLAAERTSRGPLGPLPKVTRSKSEKLATSAAIRRIKGEADLPSAHSVSHGDIDSEGYLRERLDTLPPSTL